MDQTKPLEETFVGSVLGAAIGDAMGHPTEFMSLGQIEHRFGAGGVKTFELYWEREGKRFAPYTDDTQMAEIVLRCLVEGLAGEQPLDSIMQQMAADFVAWSTAPQGGHRAPGNACMAGCAALARGVDWRVAGGEKAGGCGSVMRAYPFGLLFRTNLPRAELWAVEHSRMTHRDPIALAACAAMAVGTAMATVPSEDPRRIVSAMIDAASRHDDKTGVMMRRAADEAYAGVEPAVTLDRLEAWAAHEAIAAGLYIFARHPNDARAAILEGANTKGDSDSIATIAGALVGARVGETGLPQEWVRDVERSSELRALAVRAVGLSTKD